MNKIRSLFLIFFLVFPGVSSVHAADKGSARLHQALNDAIRAYTPIAGYSAVFYKQEVEDGKMGEREKIYLKFEKPFKIFMKWMNTKKKGVQVLYERGKNKGKLAIHKPGLLLGLKPVIFLDQNSRWVRQGSASYNIEDAGIGTFLKDFSAAVVRADKEKKLKVAWPAASVADVTFLNTKKDKVYFAYQIRVHFSANTKLPVKMELLDWQNRPMGVYEYANLKLFWGKGTEDPEFKKEIGKHLLKVWGSDAKTGTTDKTALAKRKGG